VVAPDSTGARLRRAAYANGVRDERVLGAVEAAERESFVPSGLRGRAGLDVALPLEVGQTTSQPSLVAMMLESLEIEDDDVVLEIGSGNGYQTALLAGLARQVYSVERMAVLARQARRNLAAAGVDNAEVVVGDGMLGLPEHAPYGAIVVSAAFPSVPAPLAGQLADGARLVQPLGPGGSETVVVFEFRSGKLVPVGELCCASFVPLVAGLPPGGGGRRAPAHRGSAGSGDAGDQGEADI
jgi:protein-L-isoaspartate(D-aspartate) O-methyltransferase